MLGRLWLALGALAFTQVAFADVPPAFRFHIIGSEHGGFDRVSQMALRAYGRIYVPDASRHRVVVYRQDGQYLEQIGSFGTPLGEFYVAAGVAFEHQGNLYVAEQFGDRITKLSPSHLPLRRGPSSNTGPSRVATVHQGACCDRRSLVTFSSRSHCRMPGWMAIGSEGEDSSAASR